MGADQRDRPCTGDQVFQEGTVAQGIPITPCTLPESGTYEAAGIYPYPLYAHRAWVGHCPVPYSPAGSFQGAGNKVPEGRTPQPRGPHAGSISRASCWRKGRGRARTGRIGR
jgi:hypothetical protein